MSEFKGTQGTWSYFVMLGEVRSSDGDLLADMVVNAEEDENGRLMAAAPELLEALKDVLLAFEEVLMDEYSTEPEDNECCVKARAAIKKALGQ